MQWENLFYALTQFVHNFGAVAIVAGALVALKIPSDKLVLKKNLAWLVLIGWSTQITSGLVFGGISLYFYGETPDLHSIALAALIIKVVCAVSGFSLVLYYIVSAKNWGDKARHRAWHSLTGFGAIALTSAAFLRWFA